MMAFKRNERTDPGGEDIMKKAMILFCLVLCVLLSACGKGKDDPMKEASGTYKLSKNKLVGDSDEYWKSDEEFTLELKADGTGTSLRDGLEIKVKWTLNEEEFTMT